MRAARVDLAGVSIELVATSDDVAEQLRWFFGDAATTRTPDLRIDVSGADDVARPGTPPDATDGPVQRWDAAEHVALWHDAGVGAVVDADSIVVGELGANPWRPLRQLLATGLAIWFGGRGDVVIHGGLLERRCGGVIVLGPTGSGKSTTAVAALAAGGSVHADDLVIVRADRHGVRAHGIPKRISIDPDQVAGLGLDPEPIPDDPRMRGMLPPTVMTTRWLDVRAVLVVAHADGDGDLTPLPPRDALAAVVGSAFEADRPASLRRDLATLARLGGAPAYRLEHARSPDRRLDQAVRLLERLDGLLCEPAAER